MVSNMPIKYCIGPGHISLSVVIKKNSSDKALDSPSRYSNVVLSIQ